MPDTKVYVLGDSLESPQRKASEAGRPQRDPARAASLSIFLWGGGQLYNGQRAGANWLFLLQVLLLGLLIVGGLNWRHLAGWLDFYFRLDRTGPVILFLLFLGGATGWIGGTFQGYRAADRRDTVRFSGKEREGIAALTSLVIPGWGQYLNGQPRKGAAFQTVALLEGLAWLTLLGAYTGFESLRRPENRAAFEGGLLGATAALPLLLFAHVLSAYDALKVARYPGLRRNLFTRMQFAWTRYRTGVSRQVPSAARRIRALVLILLLVLADLVAIFYSPRSFYADQAAWVARHLRAKGMIRAPALLDAFRQHLTQS